MKRKESFPNKYGHFTYQIVSTKPIVIDEERNIVLNKSAVLHETEGMDMWADPHNPNTSFFEPSDSYKYNYYRIQIPKLKEAVQKILS